MYFFPGFNTSISSLLYIMKHRGITGFGEGEIITSFAYRGWVQQLNARGERPQKERGRKREREFHTSHMVDAFNPNSFAVPWVHNGAKNANESQMGGHGEKKEAFGKDTMSKLS